jgi:sulfofructosephosphate aldolase
MTGITLDALARETGTFLIVAMDQRESLRTMLAAHHPAPDDAQLVRFKLAAARELGPHASGFLIDRRFGFEEIVRARLLPPGCGLVLAADALVQEPGGPVEDTDLDAELDLAAAAAAGVVALKLLVIWRPDGNPAERLALARRFVTAARSQGLLSILEGVVRPALGEEVDFDREAAILSAARELSPVGPTLYKAEVPLHGRAEPEELERRCAELDAALRCPWVVLSSGVDAADFPAAVEAACRAGASGMLAGRAVWSGAVPARDPGAALREQAVPLLRNLADIVDRYGRPWPEKA